MVLSTLHTNDAISAPIRLIDMGVPRFMVATSLQVVLAQRLVRLVCESCAENYSLKPFEHEWLRLELKDEVDRHRYMHGRGCTNCNGTGYQGRMGIYEMLEMNFDMVEAANHHDPAHFMKMARQQMEGKTLRTQVVREVLKGRTTVTEAMRISNQFIDLSTEAKAAALKGVQGGMASAMAINYAGCSVLLNVVTANKCVQVNNCSSISSVLEGGIPTGYTVGASSIAANGTVVACTITQTDGGATATFSGIGAGI